MMASQNDIHTEPMVSIIIPFHNTPCEFMQEAIDSVFAQSYDSWELLLVDDGSTGESTELAKKYAEQHSEKVRYFEHENHRNRGAGPSRNLGFNNAKGEYIAFLDADDVWLPHKLEHQVAILSSQPDTAMVYGKTEYWYSWASNGVQGCRDFVPQLGVQHDQVVHPPKLLPHFLRGSAAVPCTCSTLVRRTAIAHIGGFEEQFPGMYEDQVFYAKISLLAPVFVASACWDRYRQHPNQTCAVANRTGEADSARQKYLSWLEQYLQAQQIDDLQVCKALREELRRYERSTAGAVSNLVRYFRRRLRKQLRRMRSYSRVPVLLAERRFRERGSPPV